MEIRIYYEDTDFTGVVYHGAYVRFLERGRSDFLRLAGQAHAALQANDAIAFTVVNLTISFRRPARIDDALLVVSQIESQHGPRLYFDQRILRGETELCAAKVEAASIDLSGRPKKPTPDLVAALKRLTA